MRAVIIRFSSLGDVVLSTAVVQALTDAEWEIGFVTLPQYASLFKEDPRILKIFKFDGFASTAKAIKEFLPDWVVDLHRNQRSIVLSGLLGAKIVRTSKRNISRRMLVAFGLGSRKPQSVVDMQLKTLEKLGIFNNSSLPKIFPTQQGLFSAKEKLQGVKKPIAILHPGAKHPLKKWGTENFEKLSKSLIEKGFSVVIIDESENLDDVIYIKNLSLEELVGTIAQADIFIGNDSGPVHIAAALNIPTLSIFGPTHPALGFVPRGKNADYITADLPCSPCTLHGSGKCKFKTQKCFDEITPEMVIAKAMELWSKR